MKSRVIELQEKANQLLQMAQAMDMRAERAEYLANDYKIMFPTLSKKYSDTADTRKRGSRRLWNAYLQVLTQIKLEL